MSMTSEAGNTRFSIVYSHALCWAEIQVIVLFYSFLSQKFCTLCFRYHFCCVCLVTFLFFYYVLVLLLICYVLKYALFYTLLIVFHKNCHNVCCIKICNNNIYIYLYINKIITIHLI